MGKSKGIATIIGFAIRNADRSLFNEDYNEQAQAVMKALKEEGYEIVPVEPSETLVTYALENMPTGRMAPEEFARNLYDMFISNALRLK